MIKNIIRNDKEDSIFTEGNTGYKMYDYLVKSY